MRFYQKTMWLILSLFFFISLPFLWAQGGDAGTESPFSIGIGAKAMGLGNAMVAYHEDPSAFYWNPAGMRVVDQKSIGLSVTTLFEGTEYNYLGYIHPTLSAGTFGFGIMRIGTGGIKQYETINGLPVEMGEVGYWWGKLTLAYAVSLFKGFSIGANFNAERQVLGDYSTNGFGFDSGLHYSIPANSGFFRNFYWGCHFQNIFSPKLKLGRQTETLPSMVRTGFAKIFRFNEDRDWWSFLIDFDFVEDKPSKHHIGSEFGWGRTVYLRMGSDDGTFVFGGGLRLANFQVDYASSRIGDPEFFSRSHRFTLLFFFGESITQKKRRLEYEREAAIISEVNAQRNQDRRNQIRDGLYAGRKYFNDNDYFNAQLEFSRVLSYDPNNYEAQHWLDRTTQIEDSLQQASTIQLEQQARSDEKRKGESAFINRMFTEGRNALEKRDFQTAIEKWEAALARDPDPEHRTQLTSYVEQARQELQKEVNRLIQRAKQLTNSENIPEAYKALERAKDQARADTKLQQKVLAEIRRLDLAVEFMTSYQTGIQLYSQRNYQDAVKFFKKALNYRPNDERVKELYRNSLAYSLGKRIKMKEETKVKFTRGLELYTAGRYMEALTVWEEALEMDPYDVNVLEAVSSVKKKLEMFKQSE